jgi:hypothetical protein
VADERVSFAACVTSVRAATIAPAPFAAPETLIAIWPVAAFCCST